MNDYIIRNGVLYGYEGDDGEIVIPVGVESIAQGVFAYNENIVSVIIPEGVTSIGDNAFIDCTDLERVVLPDSLVRIGRDAFRCCSSLEEIDFGSKLTIIEDRAFEECTCLKSLTIPGNVERIAPFTFSGCVSLLEAVIPEGLKRIEREAFYNCRSLTRLKLPSTLEAIGDNAFSYCVSLNDLVIPRSVQELAAAFVDVPSVTLEDGGYFKTVDKAIVSADGKVTVAYVGDGKICHVPEGVTHIKDSAFCFSKNITEVILPTTLTHIEESAFCGCVSLRRADIPDGVTYIGKSAFSDCTALERVAIPAGVKTVSSFAFMNCTALSQAVIAEGVERIDRLAFVGCSQLDVTLPKSVKSMGVHSFEGCGCLRLPKSFKRAVDKFVRGDVPEALVVLLCRVKDIESVNEDLIYSMIRGSLMEYASGELYEKDADILKELISKRYLKTFKKFNGYRPLYEFMISVDGIKRRNIDKLIERTDDIECRAILLDHKRKCGWVG